MPKILAGLEKFVKFIFKAFEGVVILATRLASMFGRVWDFLVKLDDVTGGWSTKILAVAAAWKLLNLAFITTPIGMIITALIALLALVDDFLTWQEGGESLIDWAAWVPMIDAIKATFLGLWEVIQDVYHVIKNLGDAIIGLVTGNFAGAFDSLIKSGDKLWKLFGSILDTLEGIGNIQFGFISGIADKLGFGDASPPGSSTPSSSGQNVSQVTNINVQGANDPQATARVVGNEQSRINYDMTRNMKGAAR